MQKSILYIFIRSLTISALADKIKKKHTKENSMKHLPTELLYLLKVYNYIKFDIGLDHARSRADDIRAFIAKADYLKDYPTILEYLSEDKSMEDIITYITRNERTYSLLGEWRDREMEHLLSEKGLSGSFGFIGGMSVKKEGENGYFLLPDKLYSKNKIVLIGANIEEDIHTDKILWLEFYRTKEGMALEVFDDSCKTYKVTFSDFECRKKYYSVEPLSVGNKTAYQSAIKMSAALCEKARASFEQLNDREKGVMFIALFFDALSRYELFGNYPEISALLRENGMEKAVKLLEKIAVSEEKKKKSLSKKMESILKSKKSLSFIEKINAEIIESQKNIEAIPYNR